jgi:hypothetical protein
MYAATHGAATVAAQIAARATAASSDNPDPGRGSSHSMKRADVIQVSMWIACHQAHPNPTAASVDEMKARTPATQSNAGRCGSPVRGDSTTPKGFAATGGSVRIGWAGAFPSPSIVATLMIDPAYLL